MENEDYIPVELTEDEIAELKSIMDITEADAAAQNYRLAMDAIDRHRDEVDGEVNWEAMFAETCNLK